MNRYVQEKLKDRQRTVNAKLNIKRSYRRMQKRDVDNDDPRRSTDGGRVAKSGGQRKLRLEDIPDPYAHLRRDDDEELAAKSGKHDQGGTAKVDAFGSKAKKSRHGQKTQEEQADTQADEEQLEDENSEKDEEDLMNTSSEEEGDDEDVPKGKKGALKNGKKKKERQKPARQAKPNPFAKAMRENKADREEKDREEAERARQEKEEARKQYYAGRKRDQRAFGKKTRRGQPVFSAQIDNILNKLEKQVKR
ncbi:hypothetical protein BC829DRAFT_382697 [Chytridium lagenaria]|nr:hypothetical protein BC829DRAFT_382697 [Chytridium lagenaria]